MNEGVQPGVKREQDGPAVATDDAPWSVSPDAVAASAGVDVENGLTDEEADERRRRTGPNDLRRRKPRSAWSLFVAQFRSLVVALLIGAAVVAFAFGENLEAWAIVTVIAINAALGFITELRAVRSMEALFALSRVTARVLRGGGTREIDAVELVPGDVVVLAGGDLVPADMRLITASKLQADESSLTGESMPVGKSIDPVDAGSALAERSSMLYKGTSVTRGSGVAVVTQTGMRTELGRITELVAEAVEERTPLEVRLDALGRKLIWVTLGIAALVSGAGILRGKDLFLMIETGIALAVASIPEGLPIVATIALARGVRIMARRNALINRLSSVETLGAAGVICTDKTGTLTENRMTVVRLAVAGKDVRLDEEEGFETEIAGDLTSAVRSALEVGALCNNATRAEDGETSGDPLEVALHAAAAGFGIKQGDLLTDCERVDEEAFDADVKMMATVHRCGDRYRYAVKGAPEAVLEACGYEQTDEAASPLDESRRAAWEEKNEALAAGGLRVLALAEKYSDSREDAPYEGLVMLGLVGMADPPRSDVRPSIERCKSAGIQVVMVTGDQPVTALGIGREVGLVDEGEDLVVRGNELPAMDSATDEQKARLLRVPIFARVTPAQKLDLIALHQGGGHVVAMTGDGVNDAPALQKADIGIAMGRRGTQVAREAADMVLQDDAFSTIVAAVEQGRIIFGNIRRFVLYLLSCNVSEVMVVAAATLVGGPLPLLPLQILFLNLVTDIFPALALGVGAGDPAVMKRKPRAANEPVLLRRHWLVIAFYGVLMTASVLGALFVALNVLHLPAEEAVTLSFLTLAFAQLLHVFNMRSKDSSTWKNEVVQNPFVWGAIVLCTGLLLGAVYVPDLAEVLSVHRPDAMGWLTVAGFSLIPLVVGQVVLILGGNTAVE